jgi:hypothetical protein
MRKLVTIVLVLCGGLEISGWRKGMSNLRKVKWLFRKVQNLKRSISKNPGKKAVRDRLVVEAHLSYLEFVRSLLDRARAMIAEIPVTDAMAFARVLEIQKFVDYAERQIDQIRRKHSVVESSINALEQGGLDRCPDHGIQDFKRYIGLAVVARNLHTIGNILQKKESEREKRRMAQKRRIAA